MSRTFVAAVLAAALFASAFGPAAADTKNKRIAFVATSTKNPFIAAIARTIEKEGQARGMKVTVLTSGYDSAAQDQLIGDTIAQKYDAIALLPVDAHAVIPALTRAKQAGLPVVLVNSPIEPGHEDLYTAFVGERQEELGNASGEALVHAVKNRKTAKIAIISGTLSEATPQLRIESFKKAIAKDPKIRILSIEDAKWNMAKSEQIAGQLFARYAAQGGLDAIYAMADNMAHGVVQAAKAADVQLGTSDGKLIVVSSTCMKFGMDHIRAGRQYSTATNLPTRTGRVAVEVIADVLNGKTVKKNNFQPVESITGGNVGKYVKACTY